MAAHDDPTAEADLAAYRAAYGLPPCTTANGCFRKVNQEGQPAPLPPYDPDDDWWSEVSLDLDAVSAVCPDCHLLLVEAGVAAERDRRRRHQPRQGARHGPGLGGDGYDAPTGMGTPNGLGAL